MLGVTNRQNASVTQAVKVLAHAKMMGLKTVRNCPLLESSVERLVNVERYLWVMCV